MCDNPPTDFVIYDPELFSAFSTIFSEREASLGEFFDIVQSANPEPVNQSDSDFAKSCAGNTYSTKKLYAIFELILY